MTAYEKGFTAGERDAWQGRNRPLPKPPEICGDDMRGYWDARLPRSPNWARSRVTQTRWDEGRGRYVASQTGQREAA